VMHPREEEAPRQPARGVGVRELPYAAARVGRSPRTRWRRPYEEGRWQVGSVATTLLPLPLAGAVPADREPASGPRFLWLPRSVWTPLTSITPWTSLASHPATPH